MPERSDISQLTESPQSEADMAEWAECQRLGKQCGLPCVRLRECPIDPELIKKLPVDVLETYKMVPIGLEGYVITIAMADPLDVVAEDVVRYATGYRVKRVVAPVSQILEVIKGGVPAGETLLDTILRRIPESGEITYLQSADAAAERQEQESAELEPTAPIIQLVSSIIGDAIRMGASDIHVEPMKHTMRVRYRLDGYLRTIVELPQRVQSACITRFKIISGLDISESRKPQDGRSRAVLDGREIDMRVSSLPTYSGEKIVLRILDPKAVMVDLNNLGLNPENLASVKEVLASSQGVILCTGPTGSGKTSTLYSALLQLNQEADNVVTVEDPIEYQLEGINQVQVNVRAGVTFAAALRSILRQDPDVVLIGEIRDLETAEIAVQSAQTGHLVLSTLHTNDALSTINRLVLMGVAPYLLASSLLCVIAQRLVRRLCPHCRAVGTPAESALALLKASGVNTPLQSCFEPRGCEACNYVGYRGRMGIFELLMVTDRVRQLLLEQASEAELERLARSEGMRSLLEDGLAKCQDGSTSLDELLRVITIRRVGGRRCPHCDASIPPEHPICVYCGQPVLVLCPHCASTLQPEWHFCPECRQAVGDGPLAPPTSEILEGAPSGPVPVLEEIDHLNGQKWVLLMTTDSLVRAQLSACLVEEEFCVLTASDGVHATTLIHYHMPDVIVVDWDTQDLHVEAWIAGVRSRLDSSLISILLLTSVGASGINGLHCGADSYLIKPFEEGRFLTRILELLKDHPRMTGPAKLPVAKMWAGQQIPRLFTDPLRRLLAASHCEHFEVAVAELASLSRLVVQYCYALSQATLRHFGRIPGYPLWGQPESLEALDEKAAALADAVTELESLRLEDPLLGPLIAMVAEAASQVAALQEMWHSQPTPSQAKERLAHGLSLLRPWLEKARPFCAQAEHFLESPNAQGVISGAIAFGEATLTLDEPAVLLYTRFAETSP